MDNTVTIDRAEYDLLLAAQEDLEDILAYDQAKADFASGADELIPAEFVYRLLEGESRLRVHRERRGMTQTGLAQVASVNRVQIANIEAGRKTGSVNTIRKLAAALGVTIDDLV